MRGERAWWCAAVDRRQRFAPVAREAGARAVHVSDDVTGFARSRDARVEEALGRDGIALHRHPGLYVADLPRVTARPGRSV